MVRIGENKSDFIDLNPYLYKRFTGFISDYLVRLFADDTTMLFSGGCCRTLIN